MVQESSISSISATAEAESIVQMCPRMAQREKILPAPSFLKVVGPKSDRERDREAQSCYHGVTACSRMQDSCQLVKAGPPFAIIVDITYIHLYGCVFKISSLISRFQQH